jgi:hypothetical protein
MSATVGDFLVERLHEWGVRRIFGYPGDGINGLLGALGRAGDKFEFVRRHGIICARSSGWIPTSGRSSAEHEAAAAFLRLSAHPTVQGGEA